SSPRSLVSLLSEPAPPELSSLSLHDALPILLAEPVTPGLIIGFPIILGGCWLAATGGRLRPPRKSTAAEVVVPGAPPTDPEAVRSEEHTSELQSREKLVCRLLLEKKKGKQTK